MTGTIDTELLSRVCVLADATLSDVNEEQLKRPTPCSEWVVQDLMEHIVSAADFFAETAALGAVPDDRDWPDYNAGELVPAFRRHAHRLVAAFERDGAMSHPMLLPSGPTTGSNCIQVAVGELYIHSWDLRRSTGQAIGDTDIADVLLASDWMALCGRDPHFSPAA